MNFFDQTRLVSKVLLQRGEKKKKKKKKKELSRDA